MRRLEAVLGDQRGPGAVALLHLVEVAHGRPPAWRAGVEADHLGPDPAAPAGVHLVRPRRRVEVGQQASRRRPAAGRASGSARPPPAPPSPPARSSVHEAVDMAPEPQAQLDVAVDHLGHEGLTNLPGRAAARAGPGSPRGGARSPARPPRWPPPRGPGPERRTSASNSGRGRRRPTSITSHTATPASLAASTSSSLPSGPGTGRARPPRLDQQHPGLVPVDVQGPGVVRHHQVVPPAVEQPSPAPSRRPRRAPPPPPPRRAGRG